MKDVCSRADEIRVPSLKKYRNAWVGYEYDSRVSTTGKTGNYTDRLDTLHFNWILCCFLAYIELGPGRACASV